VSTRPTGTVVGIGDIDYIRWPGSEWRCLQVISHFPDFQYASWHFKLIFYSFSNSFAELDFTSSQVQWDSTSDTFLHPERVSPWNIELIESTNKKKKRTRPLDPALPGFSSRTRDGLWPLFNFCFKFQTWMVSLDFGKS
jgi:hypothetical protein